MRVDGGTLYPQIETQLPSFIQNDQRRGDDAVLNDRLRAIGLIENGLSGPNHPDGFRSDTQANQETRVRRTRY